MTTSVQSVSATQSKIQVNNQDSFSFDSAGGLAGISSINSGYLYGNRVINGAQEIDQVNSGAAVTPGAGTSYLTDMFGYQCSVASKLTFQQITDAPAGLKSSLKVTVASQYSPAAAEFFGVLTAVEGKDIIDFQFGTAGAVTITLSHWIKSSIAGTYCVAIRNGALNRTYLGTVAVGTTWSQVKITLQGDTSGTWATDTTTGLNIWWDLGSGSNFNTTAGSWQAGALTRTSGSVTFVNQVAGSTLNITGVDCRLGSVAPTVFERRANELQLAQRYYAIVDTRLAGYTSVGVANQYNMQLCTQMRTTPTITVGTTTNTNTTGATVVNSGNGHVTHSSTGVATGGFISAAIATLSARLF